VHHFLMAAIQKIMILIKFTIGELSKGSVRRVESIKAQRATLVGLFFISSFIRYRCRRTLSYRFIIDYLSELACHFLCDCIPISAMGGCPLSLPYSYDTRIVAFSSILLVIIKKSGAIRVHTTISALLSHQFLLRFRYVSVQVSVLTSEFINFLVYAQASRDETEVHLDFIQESGYLNDNDYDILS
jgi:hypothetical protein